MIYIAYVGVIFGVIQLIPVDRKNPSVKMSENFVDIYKTPQNIKNILQRACYDCHSNETIYPRYSYIAPISWSIKNHINEGREHMNLSIWETYNKDLQLSMLENSIADLEQERMPLRGYIAQHPKAKLTKQETTQLIDYLKEKENTIK